MKACAAKIDELKKALSDFVMQHTPRSPEPARWTPSRRWDSSA
jgi:hypothetical protein